MQEGVQIRDGVFPAGGVHGGGEGQLGDLPGVSGHRGGFSGQIFSFILLSH